MPESNILLYITGELAILLLVVCVFLLFHVSKLKGLIAKLEAKIVTLRRSMKKSRKEAEKALGKLAEHQKIKPKKFLDYLDEAIDETRSHHQSLNPDRDIVLDISPDAPLERQADSLRHAFLIAEKEARYAGDEDESSWDVLQAKFQQIIHFYETSAAVDIEVDEPELDEANEEELEALRTEVENYKKRITNLEGFKKLFFEMETNWEGAKKEADDYHQQLLAMGQELGAGEDFDNLLDRYASAFDGIGELIASGGDEDTPGSATTISTGLDHDNSPPGERVGVGKMVIANQEEMQRLRNMAVDQHKVITELKKQLYSASSEEEQQQVMEGLTTQLEQQQRFLKEAETCTQLIEDELTRTIGENEDLRSQIESASAGASAEEAERLEALVGDLTTESRDMLSVIGALEEQNRGLQEQLESGTGGSDENTDLLTEKLGELQQELLNLQTQHIELEERYLELKMKG